ncbi:unnamed protein product [Rhizoctonia solani]|uniref:Uncharacterized protein n=1 Tax=Rhizoctonia solani TaxID=456999 RepID=A0A8H3BF87_9AGAM|nr:unnamed protein product [Rhizoctonia solani]
MSTITKLNSPDRAAQKVGTLIDMVTIRQYYKREEAVESLSPRPLRPTVRFADLTSAVQILTPDCDATQAESIEFDGPAETSDEPAPIGCRNYFEVEREDGVFLASKLLEERRVATSTLLARESTLVCLPSFSPSVS